MMFLLVGIAGTSSIFGFINLYHIKVKLLSHERFFADTDVEYKLLCSNSSNEDSYDINIRSKEHIKHIGVIKKHQDIIVAFRTSFVKRGLTSLEKIKVDSLFPLPHELKYKYINLEKEIVVYPRPKGISLLKFYNKDNSLNGELDEFEGISKFTQGDNPSYIHWSSLAKHNTLMLKNYQYQHENQTLDFDFNLLEGTTEERLSQLTLWCLECEKYHLAFSIKLENRLLNSQKESIDEILKQLALF